MLGIKTAALPASLRRTNQRTVISLLLRMGSASRADLAKAAGISQPTAGKIITDLLDLGVLQLAGDPVSAEPGGIRGGARLGRPGQLLCLDGGRRRFLAVQLGVLETRVAALPVAVNLHDEWTRTFPTPDSASAWLDALIDVTAASRSSDLWGILISVPGIADEAEGRVVFSPNLHWIETVPLTELVQDAFHLPTLLTQEIRALALGHLAAEPVREDFLLVDFGQGVGGAVVTDGQLHSHPMPLGGEFGHTPVRGNLRRCGCGAVGCLETLVSRRGLVDSLAEAPLARPRAGTQRLGPGSRGTDGKTQTRIGTSGSPLRSGLPVSGALAEGWRELVSHVTDHGLEPWLADTLDSTARVIAGALNVLGIQRVVVTGSLTELPPCVFEHLAASIKEGAIWSRFGEVSCLTAPRRRAAGLVAAGIDRLVLPAAEDNRRLLPRVSA